METLLLPFDTQAVIMKTRLARSSVYVFSTGFVVGAAVVESWRMYQEPFGGTRQADRDLLEDGPSKSEK